MKNNYYSIYPCINIYERPSINSKISSQIIYGEKFKVLRKVKNFLKIRTSYDRYRGYIKNKMRENRILIGSDGPKDNVIKIRPPLTIELEDAEMLLATLSEVLEGTVDWT